MSQKYHKIQTVFKRDPETNYRRLLEGHYALPEFHYLSSIPWHWTEKVDGTNIRVEYLDREFDFRGRGDNSEIPGPLYQHLTTKFAHRIVIAERVFPTQHVVFYGEGYGDRIQKHGKLYADSPKFVLFDVMVDGKYLDRENVEDVADKLKLDVVPIIGVGSLEEMVARARHGFMSTWGDFEAEGIVARPRIELYNKQGNRIITKIKCSDFR